MSEIPELYLVAAALKAGQADHRIHSQSLLDTLAGVLPSAVTSVQRKRTLGDALKGRPGIVTSIEIMLDRFRYSLTTAPTGLKAERHHEQGGIRIGSETMPLNAWLEELAAALTLRAQTDQLMQDSLRRLTGLG